MKKEAYEETKLLCCSLMMLLLFPSGAFAQQQMIKGQVVDDKGKPLLELRSW